MMMVYQHQTVCGISEWKWQTSKPRKE